MDTLARDTESVMLKNGEDMPRMLVQTMMYCLHSLLDEAPLAFYELVSICRDREHEFFSDVLREELETRGLIEPDGQPHSAIRSILLSALAGEGMSLVLGSPYEETEA